MNTLFLRLEGPLQAWGRRANWEERDTADAPTKSGIIGLLGCALGYRRDDGRLRDLSDALLMGVRVDLGGTLMADYHTTGGAKTLDGKPEGVLGTDGKRKPETDLSRRYYLADASFLAALQGPSITIARLAEALQNPVWPCYLGRKSCVPAHPIFVGLGEFDDLKPALKSQPFSQRVLAGWKKRKQPNQVRLLIEVKLDEGQGNRQSDNIGTPARRVFRQSDNIGTPSRRVFRPRYVAEEWLTPGDEPPTLNTLEG